MVKAGKTIRSHYVDDGTDDVDVEAAWRLYEDGPPKQQVVAPPHQQPAATAPKQRSRMRRTERGKVQLTPRIAAEA